MHTQESLIHLTYQASAAIWVFVAITSVIFFMRTYSRLFLSKDPLNWDDFIISLSWVSTSSCLPSSDSHPRQP